MTDNERFELFITTIRHNRTIWLLEAKPGLFAMLEDNNENAYIPIWHTEAEAQNAAQGDWQTYQASPMAFGELHEWLKELETDAIDIAVFPDENEKILPLKPPHFKQLIS